MNRLTITPSGLEIVNTPIVREIDGLVTAAEVSDIDASGSPEIWVFVTSAGSGCMYGRADQVFPHAGLDRSR